MVSNLKLIFELMEEEMKVVVMFLIHVRLLQFLGDVKKDQLFVFARLLCQHHYTP